MYWRYLKSTWYSLSQGFSCNPTVCHHFGCSRAAALPLGALAASWLACRNLLITAPGSAPWTGPVGNLNTACTDSHYSFCTCLPSPRTDVHTFCSSEILCLWFTTLPTHDHESLQIHKLCRLLRKAAFQFS